MNGTSITIAGNIATQPEQRTTAGGVTYLRFRIASGERRFDKTSGRWEDGPTSWYTVSMFRGLAEHAARSLHKGERVILTGRLRIRRWESGEKHGTDAEIEADAIGHDLRWGTSHFEKTPAQQATSSAQPGTEWVVPGTDSAPQTEQNASWPLVEVPTAARAEETEAVQPF